MKMLKSNGPKIEPCGTFLHPFTKRVNYFAKLKSAC